LKQFLSVGTNWICTTTQKVQSDIRLLSGGESLKTGESIYPNNFLDMAAPVSRVPSTLRCEYNSLKSRYICLKLPPHLLWLPN